ncbi:TetR/AcrR family transcriptional regulator [Candidatus Macondimonas diazotrophica]|jgi:AcrR family transcriptional regulator|uniref:TetR/AcrR family transcriptional regulator n=1 Tax=Candidatus Macondimonas diazotrophica TaxID=2305248 RepID=A0A4Z0F9B0_9GAMM|nr:TetR/AcrR family transcriptional regulator [Candidatus Macondimonas diazotrophica]
MTQPPKPAVIDLETRERILQTAFEMFGRYGYDGVSIDQISKACGLSKGAMYWYFRNKEALFVECVKRLRKLFVAHIYGPMAGADNPCEQMLKFFQGIESILKDSENLESVSGLLIGVGRVDRDLIKEFRVRARRDAEQFLASILENGRQFKHFRFLGDALPVARALFIVLEGCLVQARSDTAEQTADAVHRLALGFFLACGAKPPAELGYETLASGVPAPIS